MIKPNALTDIELLDAIPFRNNCSLEKDLNKDKLACLTTNNSVNKS